jgi:hypothetical protein
LPSKTLIVLAAALAAAAVAAPIAQPSDDETLANQRAPLARA